MIFLDLKMPIVVSFYGPFSEFLTYKLVFPFLERIEKNQ